MTTFFVLPIICRRHFQMLKHRALCSKSCWRTTQLYATLPTFHTFNNFNHIHFHTCPIKSSSSVRENNENENNNQRHLLLAILTDRQRCLFSSWLVLKSANLLYAASVLRSSELFGVMESAMAAPVLIRVGLDGPLFSSPFFSHTNSFQLHKIKSAVSSGGTDPNTTEEQPWPAETQMFLTHAWTIRDNAQTVLIFIKSV